MLRYPDPGTVLLGKYRVDSLIGEGGMGAVVKAWHLDLDQPVAIKCLLPEMMTRGDIVQRFLREARSAAKLKGEHVARVLDSGRLESQVPFIVMEYLDGADLNAIIKHHGAQASTVAVDLVLQACEAIAEAHSIGIIHRDIKASNFFVTQPDNQEPCLKVLDFGIATAPDGAGELTSTQSVMGTPAYMAPEQMRSSRTADVRSDIWSMGVVLYELLEGARPFRSDVYPELCLKVGMDPPMPMMQPIPHELGAVVWKCLEKPVDRRYQSIAELAFDLMPFAADPSRARTIVEQCARLLGTRSTRSQAIPRYDADRTPAPLTPSVTPTPSAMAIPRPIRGPASAPMAAQGERLTNPLTPGTLTPVPQAPLSVTPIPTLLGRPTPMPTAGPSTPTSVNASNGQVAMLGIGMGTGASLGAAPVAASGRRGWIIATTAAALIAVGGVAIFAASRSGGGGTQAATSTLPAAAAPVAPAVVAAAPVAAVAAAPVAPVAAAPVAPAAVVTPTATQAAVIAPTPTPIAPTPPPITPPPIAPTPPPIAATVTPTPQPKIAKATPTKKTEPAIRKPDPKKPAPTEPGGDLYTKRQ